MSNSYFDFKQFRICHDRCAMKVGTDAVLLGAWARLDGCRRVLDIGCGSGILSLMAAQRAKGAMIKGIDIDASSVEQACQNAQESVFADRVVFEYANVKDYSSEECYDAILCNPPFYTEDTKCPDSSRDKARHCNDLTFEELVKHAKRLLAEKGAFHVVIPTKEEKTFTAVCAREGLYLSRKCEVRTTPRKLSKRVLCTYLTSIVEVTEFEELVLMINGKRSEAFHALTNDFYLDVQQPS